MFKLDMASWVIGGAEPTQREKKKKKKAEQGQTVHGEFVQFPLMLLIFLFKPVIYESQPGTFPHSVPTQPYTKLPVMLQILGGGIPPVFP